MSQSIVERIPLIPRQRVAPAESEATVTVAGTTMAGISMVENVAASHSDESVVRAAGRETVRKHAAALKRLADN